MNRLPMITAHSGCEDTEIDSLESVEKALELGADGIEIDVRVDQAGTLRISHNAVSQQEYLEKLTLRKILERIRETDLAVNFDLKEPQALYKTLEEAEALGFGRDRLIFSGCTGPEQLVRDETLCSRGRFFVNIEEVLKFLYFRNQAAFDLEQFSALMNDPWSVVRGMSENLPDSYVADTVKMYGIIHAEAANLPKRLLAAPVIDALQKAGVPLSIWTVNEAKIAQQCLDLGVLNITTRRVEQTIRIRKNAGKDAD